MADPDLMFWTDERGDPWACVAWGEVPPDAFTPARIRAAADWVGCGDGLDLDAITVSQFHIRQGMSEYLGDEMWFPCPRDADGARLVTGVRF